MKLSLIVLSILVSGSASATSIAPEGAPAADCSRASKGIVKVTSEGRLIDVATAAKIAYSQCLVKTKSIAAARAAAVKKAKFEDENQCGLSGELQTLETSSWVSERGYMGENGKITNGGESTRIVVDSITCSGMGTGLFSGTVSQVAVRLSETHTNIFDEGDENDTKQVFEFSNATLVKLP